MLVLSVLAFAVALEVAVEAGSRARGRARSRANGSCRLGQRAVVLSVVDDDDDHGAAAIRLQRVNGFRVNSFQTRQRNVFGSRTFVDQHGNVFEQDAFGNTAFRGNAFANGFRGTSLFGSRGRTLVIDNDDDD